MSQLFKKEIEKGLTAISDRIGFKKKKYNFFKPINDNVFATLGFGMATHTEKGHIYVNVTIGVSHKNVEELRTKLTGYNSLEIMQPTIGRQIGYLMPENSFKEWDFAENMDNSHAYEDILKNIQTYGFAYHESMKDFDSLFEAIYQRVPGVLNQGRDRYLPIFYYLKGEKQKGLEAIEDAIERQKQPISEAEKERLKKLAGLGGQVIIGSGYGNVDPEYLKFVDKYITLWTKHSKP